MSMSVPVVRVRIVETASTSSISLLVTVHPDGKDLPVRKVTLLAHQYGLRGSTSVAGGGGGGGEFCSWQYGE